MGGERMAGYVPHSDIDNISKDLRSIAAKLVILSLPSLGDSTETLRFRDRYMLIAEIIIKLMLIDGSGK